MFFSNFNNKIKAFALIEVLVALAILSTLFLAILQAQSDTSYVYDLTRKRILAQKYIRIALFEAERNFKNLNIGRIEGIYDVDHELSGSRWIRIVDEITLEEALGIALPDESNVQDFALFRFSYQILWKDKNKENSLKGVIYVEGRN